MWNYSGSSDGTRVSQEDVSEEDVKTMVRLLTSLTTSNDVPITCRANAFNKDHPTPPVIVACAYSSIIPVFSFSYSWPASQDHGFPSSLPPVNEDGAVPEATPITESEAAETTTSRGVELEDDADSEASHTKAFPPSATSRGEKEVEKKRKRLEAKDSESSGESHPMLVTPRVAVPSSPEIKDPFDLVQVISFCSGGESPPKHHLEAHISLKDFVVAPVSLFPEGTVDSTKSPKPDEKPHSPARNKAKTSGALKGILISSIPASPPLYHAS
jgi:hypothetical protein